MPPRLWHRLRALRRGRAMDRALDAEVRFHIDMQTETHVRQGMSPEAARTRAMKEFGPMERHYGVVAAFVGQRTAEFGVRMAPGAPRSEVLRLVLGQTLRASLAPAARAARIDPVRALRSE